MRIIVVGGASLGTQVALALRGSGNDVTVLEIAPVRVGELKRLGLHAVRGDGVLPSSLEAAGALRADVLVACTGSDEENLVVALLAKRHFELPHVVARVNDAANTWLFDESWGVDVAVSPSSAIVVAIEGGDEARGGAGGGGEGGGVGGVGEGGGGIAGSAP